MGFFAAMQKDCCSSNQTDKIVVRFVLTIYPYPLGGSMHPSLDDAAFRTTQRMKDDKGFVIELPNDPFDLADLQPSHNAIDNVAFYAAHATVPAI